MYLAYVLGQGNIMECCEKVFTSIPKTSGGLMYPELAIRFINGIVSYQIYRTTRSSSWEDRARKCKGDIELWAEPGSLFNFQNKVLLLEAEENYSRGNIERAKVLYKDSIQAARCNKLINDEALTCELAAKFYFETGDLYSSMEYYRLAHGLFSKYGAVTKSTKLFLLIQERFAPLLNGPS